MPKNSKRTGRSFAPVRLLERTVGVVQLRWRRIFGEKTPHKSFTRTYRRDAIRPLVLPGYLSFTVEVFKTIFAHKRIFLTIALIYAILYAVLVGIGSQEAYRELVDLLKESTEEFFGGEYGAVWQSGVLFMTIASTGLSGELTSVQQLLSIALVVMMWLSVVWLLRNILAGKRVKVRDGLYNAGTPLFASLVVALLMIAQLVPVGIALIGYAAASSVGILAGGVEAMLFWLAAGLLGVLSLYWIVSSFFALIIITIPGTYPLWALHTSSKLVSGRRMQLLLRLVWQVGVTMVTWATVLIPVILIDAGLKQLIPAIEWMPLVPLTLVALTSWTVLWTCVYIYLLYRKVVDNEQ